MSKCRRRPPTQGHINIGSVFKLFIQQILKGAVLNLQGCKSGNEIKCQGYEPFALQELINNDMDETDIITGCKNVPIIYYYDESGKKHRHYVDIYIPTQNKCIEVKSNWTIKDKKANIFNKQKAAKDLGYEYEIWVYD
jgi:hypothetical protein